MLNSEQTGRSKERKTLAPMTRATKPGPRQSHTISATTAPQAPPSSKAVFASRRKAARYQRKWPQETQGLNRDGHGLDAHALGQRQDERQKEGSTMRLARVNS